MVFRRVTIAKPEQLHSTSFRLGEKKKSNQRRRHRKRWMATHFDWAVLQGKCISLFIRIFYELSSSGLPKEFLPLFPPKSSTLYGTSLSVKYVTSKSIGISQSRHKHVENDWKKKDGLLDLVLRLGYEPINFLSVGRAERHNLPYRTALW